MEIIREELHSKLSDIVEIFEPTLRDVEDILDAIKRRRYEFLYKHPCNLMEKDSWTEFELGMLAGELSALRWVIGKEWRDIVKLSRTIAQHE